MSFLDCRGTIYLKIKILNVFAMACPGCRKVVLFICYALYRVFVLKHKMSNSHFPESNVGSDVGLYNQIHRLLSDIHNECRRGGGSRASSKQALVLLFQAQLVSSSILCWKAE